jgi:EmrB/QacA subfamily drug resistance transporter
MRDKIGHKWLVLAIVALAQFMAVLDASVVNVAMPAVQRAFHLSATNLQWIVTAYTLLFGGFLLLGGRAADLYGRRRMFMIGVTLFGIASLLDGLSSSGGMLIGLRAAQGLAAALMSPAALSIVLNTFKPGHDRNVALSVWGAVASSGAAAGLLLGGILTQYLNWRWNFFINVPMSALVLVGAWKYVPAHESEETHNNLDLPGAALVTSGMMLLVYGLVKAPSLGWTSGRSLLYLGSSVVLLVGFVLNEMRAKHPLVPLSIFKIRNVVGANLTQLPLIASMFSVFYFTSLYVQLILKYSPVRTGLSFLVVPLGIAITATNAPRLVKRIGYKKILVFAPMLVVAGLFLLAHIPVQGDYVTHVLPGMALLGLGMGFSFVSVTIAATSGVPGNKAGLASGLINTSQQIGGALGLAILTGLASSRTAHLLSQPAYHNPQGVATALVHGYHTAYYAALGFVVLAILMAVFIVKEPKGTEQHELQS